VNRAPSWLSTVGRDYADIRTVRTARVQRTARDRGGLWHCDGLFRSVRNAMLRDREPTDYRYVDWLYAAEPPAAPRSAALFSGPFSAAPLPRKDRNDRAE
jgi:hypothetical protein